jgi:hypothetical protein
MVTIQNLWTPINTRSRHVLSSKFDQKHAIFIKHANYVYSFLFGKLGADVKQILVNYYCMSVVGCVLWKIGSENIDLSYSAWHRTIRRICPSLHMLHATRGS